MNTILFRVQKNFLISLLPLILFFTFSCAYLIRSVTRLLLNIPQIQLIRTDTMIHLNESNVTPKPISFYENIITGNFIRSQNLEEHPSIANKNKPAPKFTSDLPGTDELLISGAISGSNRFARVTIKAKNYEEAEEYAIGEKIKGYTVKAISQYYATFSKDKIELKVGIGETFGDAKKKIESLNSTKINENDSDTKTSLVIKKIIFRTDVEKALLNPAIIYNARFAPFILNGKISGIKLYFIPKDHIFEQLGAKAGDIILRANGMPLTETEKMLEIWNSLKNSPRILVDIDRNGSIVTYDFTVRN